MNDAEPMQDLMIADLQISAISDAELEETFHRVLAEHKDAVVSIHQSMTDADEAYRKYLTPDFIPIEEEAKKDRANLNRAEKNIAEKFASLKSAYERPLERIEMNIKEIRNAIKGASCVVDSKVKAYEEEQKSKKREEIQAYFDSKKFDLVPLEKIFDKTWLNKGTKMRDIKERIDEDIAGIYRDIEVLERIPDHGQTAKAIYLETLDMGAALRQVDILKANAERLAREQAAREERKNLEQVARNAAGERHEERAMAKEERVQSLVDQALELPAGTIAAQEKKWIGKYTLQFEGTEQQLLKLREYMTSVGIPYRKALLFDTETETALFMQKHNMRGRVHFLVFTAA
jgi:hypothetical protein